MRRILLIALALATALVGRSATINGMLVDATDTLGLIEATVKLVTATKDSTFVKGTTTDVNNVQMGFMQILRIATRTPAMLVLSMTMCFIISPKLSTIFLIAVAVVGSVMPMIGRLAGKTFSSVFQRYDTINARVEENVTGARVVKAFVRQDYESEKYAKATHDLRSKFVKAEMVVAMNMPVMTLVINSCTIALSWFGARMVVLSGGTALTTGQLTSMFSYTMQILMSMMMLNMIFVMMSMAGASAKRIIEVLEEEPDIKNGPDPLMTVEDGSIDFNDVTFRYSETSDDPVLRNIEPETAILQMFDFLRNLDVLVPLDLMIIYHEANRYGVSQFGCQFSTFHCAIPLVFIGLAACAQLTETRVESKLKYQDIYTTSRMTSVSRYGRIQLSREERSRNDAPDYAFMHIHNRSDADADRYFGMLTWNAIRYHRKKIGFSYGYLI